MTITTMTTDIDRDIERDQSNLRQWLAEHTPSENWNAANRKAYQDRLNALLMLNEISRNIKNLRQWLAEHTPSENWNANQIRAYNDRLTSLARWIAKSQRTK